MSKRKIFVHVLSQDIEIGDSLLVEKPSNEQGSYVMYKHLITVTSVHTGYGQVEIEGRDEDWTLYTVLIDLDRLMPVVQ